jgi:hypothetical protein
MELDPLFALDGHRSNARLHRSGDTVHDPERLALGNAVPERQTQEPLPGRIRVRHASMDTTIPPPSRRGMQRNVMEDRVDVTSEQSSENLGALL